MGGGQKQRLSIALTLLVLGNVATFLLHFTSTDFLYSIDEATSALDATSYSKLSNEGDIT